MSVLNFIKSLLPRIERSHIAEDLRATEKELSKVTVPSFQAASDGFKVIKFQSDDSLYFQNTFNRLFKPAKSSHAANFIAEITSRLKNFQENVGFIQEVLDNVLEKDVINTGLTVKSAFVIRAASNMSFVSRYLPNLLNYLYTAEAKARDAELSPALEISKAEVKFVEKNFELFVKLFQNYAEEPKTFKNIFEGVPEVYLTDRNKEAVIGLLEKGRVDPYEDGLTSGFVGSPIYSVRLIFAQWQNDRYESAKAKKQQLELRLLYLENQQKDRKDPALENEIRHLQDRIEKLDYRLRETDKELGI